MANESVLHPSLIVPVGHVEPVPRRIRGLIGGRVVFDTRRALYVWEWRAYPQFSIPVEDLVEGVLIDDDHTEHRGAGPARRHTLQVGSEVREGAAWVWEEGSPERLLNTVRFDWDALDSWFEEDEPVFVHPRSPYSRVDALRSASSVRVELDGVVLAEAPNCVKLFETGLPTRYYVERMHVDWTKLRRSDTVTRCPYKGTTSGYWSFDSDTASHEDIAWAYDFPTIHANRIAGLAAFYNEHVDLYVDGVLLPRPTDPTRGPAK
ncbi:uncharacterized protein (DUF427 family) [Streptomyces sp. 3212.3]|uniref:DUF427 domain-containing protein n=1 Tax=unclassified Streptomyces TaxID=2593676 RepID=UPI0007411457|nr:MULTISPECIES: DUF427 domain-containing protein [unclassified Streptomyces]KUJ33899.1 hypothetical protein ADL25_43355 [Streptomyces sp. NRRL F-5122]REE65826.1 uncharacterized protein (DUF427 family) [Streptomyces sp. 3212.3]